ncbi:DNA cytosine methyltransferase [Saccharopolyspora shandongensis]|uniref:DNA cytosine methyltransferase n=1 Tax=Saccharopolyspora shandongensis TaxID=418495 RepID=UPI0034301BB5
MTHAQRPKPHTDEIHMVDLFAGPGGLDVAAHWLGLTVEGVEWDGDAYLTREKAGLLTRHKDVRKLGPQDFPDADFRILAGGPPCQTYTIAGTGAGRRALDDVLKFVKRMASGNESLESIRESLRSLNDERTGLVLEPLRWALDAHRQGRPYDAIVLEQVPAVLPVWEAYKEALDGIGYKTADPRVLHTEEYGVPQTRRRAILIARRDYVPSFPQATHYRYRKGVPCPEPESELAFGPGHEPTRHWVSMGSALKRNEAFVVRSNYGTGGDPKARGERASTEPAFTVTGKVSRNRLMIDGTDCGRFEDWEAGRLQTFPRDFPWAGSAVAQQIGNAIPPRLAAHVLAAVLGWKLKSEQFDAAVEARWTESRDTKPLMPPAAG